MIVKHIWGKEDDFLSPYSGESIECILHKIFPVKGIGLCGW